MGNRWLSNDLQGEDLYWFVATPKYKITAQLSPGITGFEKDGIPVHSWSAKDIEQLAVDKQSLEHEILKLEKNLELIPIERTRLNNQIVKANK